MDKYLKDFLRDVYPGIRRTPKEMVRMMALPDINPDANIAGASKPYS